MKNSRRIWQFRYTMRGADWRLKKKKMIDIKLKKTRSKKRRDCSRACLTKSKIKIDGSFPL